MNFRNSPTSYGVFSKTFHWVMAAIVIFMLALGFFMDGAEPLTFKLKLYNLHKSLGVTVLSFVALRVIWHIISKAPPFVEGLAWWERAAAKTVHIFLYAAMFGMPLSGWMYSSAAGRSVQFFGLFTLPDLVAPDESLREQLGFIHWALGWMLVAAIALHVAAALKHHFINKDQTLRRMLPLILICFMNFPAKADVPKWEVTDSVIGFTGTVMKQEFTGTFKKITADILFDPEQLTKSKVTVIVDTASFDSADKERDDTARGADWFNITAFPAATFETTAIRKNNDGTFEADGNLTIRDTAVAIKLPFTLSITAEEDGTEKAVMAAEITLDRSQFGLGQGEWKDESTVGRDVKVRIAVTATRPLL